MRTLHFIFFILISHLLLGNDIEKLQTKKDVFEFLVNKVDKKFGNDNVFIKARKRDVAKSGINRYFKIDIDKNGLTDLLIDGRYLLVILDKGENEYQVLNLDRGPFLSAKSRLIAIDTTADINKIIIKQSEHENSYDTLVYRFESFIEYNPNVITDFKFSSIKFNTNNGSGTCPIFEMIINANQSASLEINCFNEQKEEFIGTIPNTEFMDLVEILKFINLEKMEYLYTVNWTDAKTANILVTFNDKTKAITDYGHEGTFGLSKLYSKLFGLRKDVHWAK